jgi:uncharacterized membrane protein YqhA
MSSDIFTFPGDGLPKSPITEEQIDRLHSKNFRDLESRLSDAEIMAVIAMEMVERAIEGRELKHEKAMFAVFEVARRLKKLQADYMAAWHGEIELDSD